MADKELKIDYEFKRLCSNRSFRDYVLLEKELLANGCKENVVVWNGFIIDGIDRYEICLSHGILFYIDEMDFDCKEAAIAWVCQKHLQTEMMTEECRRFLIGAQYSYERIANSKRRKRGVNQYTTTDSPDITNMVQMEENISGAIAEENNVAAGTVRKYACYARALLILDKKDPQLFSKIITGQYKISHNNIISLSKMSEQDVKRFNKKISNSNDVYIQYKNTRKMFQVRPKTEIQKSKAPSIKDMPEFDPDAEVVGLTLTIPSWTSSIKRTQNKANFDIVSEKAKDHLYNVLLDLEDAITEMLSIMEGS